MRSMRTTRVNEETGGKGQRERRNDEERVVAELEALSASEASESERQAKGDRGGASFFVDRQSNHCNDST